MLDYHISRSTDRDSQANSRADRLKGWAIFQEEVAGPLPKLPSLGMLHYALTR